MKDDRIINKNNLDSEKRGEYIDEICDDFCDLDRNKICDNCGKCIETDKNYKIIKITKIIK